MRRIRPLEFPNTWFRLSLMTLGVVSTACAVSFAESLQLAITPPAPPTSAQAGDDWQGIELDDLDEQLKSVVNAPAPAKVPAEIDDPSAHVSPLHGMTAHGTTASGPTKARGNDSVQEVFPELAGEAPVQVATPRHAAMSTEPSVSAPRDAADDSPAAEVATNVTPAPLPPEVAALQGPIENCLQTHFRRRLNSGQDSCWSMMHAFLGWGPNCEIQIGSHRGPKTNALAWLAQNQPCGGRRLLYVDGNRLRGREGPGYQGHPAQFLAMLAQCNVDPSFPLRVNGREFTVADLIAEEQRSCSTSRELTFKLLGLVHYLGTEATWVADSGEDWDLPRLVAWELEQPVNGAACGGTHRIMALSFAVEKRKHEGKPLDGHWWRAEKYISDYHQYTMTLQNQDGSFSSDWFRQRADRRDMERGVQTTGHILEWLTFSLPEQSLYDPRMVRSISYLTETLRQHPNHDWPVGPKGHAIRALRLYYERVFETEGNSDLPLARRRNSADSQVR